MYPKLVGMNFRLGETVMGKKVDLDSLLFCSECKRVVNDLEDLFFVTEESDNGFCSEECIETFYSAVVNQLQTDEAKIRKELNLDFHLETLNSIYDFETGNYHTSLEDLIEGNIEQPLELYSFIHDLIGDIYTHVSKVNLDDKPIYIIHVCLHYEDNCSLILFTTISEFPEIADYYRVGNRVEEDYKESNPKTFEINKEQMEALELKKSHYLADLIDKRSEEDIPFEDFMKYQKYTRVTLEEPDEIFEYEDDEMDTIRSYIKSFKEDDLTFFYVCVCQLLKNSDEGEVLMPLLTFPSTDGELYQKYKLGKLISEQIKN